MTNITMKVFQIYVSIYANNSYNFLKVIQKLVRKIGLARINEMANQIKLKSQQVFKECMVKVKFPDGIITPFVKPEKQFNQTCFMYAKSK